MNIPGPSGIDEPALLTVKRGLLVLRAFRSDRSALSNAELVRRTGLPKATVSRLTSTLLQTGFLRRAPDGRQFELGLMPIRIGHAFTASSKLLDIANPLLQDFADRFDVSVALGIREQSDILYVGYRASHNVGTLRLRLGSLMPISTTAIGHAYLWALPARERSALIRTLKADATDPASLLDQIQDSFDQLDSTGTCTVLGGYQRDAYGISLPVRIGRQRLLMGLSCGKVLVRPNTVAAERKRLAPSLIQVARQLEKLLEEFDGVP